MTELSPLLLAGTAALVFAAGVLRGLTGFGFSLAAVPLVTLLMPPARAVPITLMLQFVVSLNGLAGALRICDWRAIGMLALGAAVATPLGSWALAHLSAAPVRLVVAGFVLAAVVVLARGFRMATAPRGLLVLPFGLVAGLFNGLVGIPGPPVIAFFLASPVPTAIARASMIVLFMITAVLALVPEAALGMLSWPIAVTAAATAPAVWVGSWLGAWMYRRAPEQRYRRIALALLVATALLAGGRAVADLVG